MKPSDPNDIIGMRIGKIVVIQFLRKEDHHVWYLVKCDCGTEYEKKKSTIIMAKAKSAISSCTRCNKKSKRPFNTSLCGTYGK